MTTEEAQRRLLEISDAFRKASEYAVSDNQKSTEALMLAAKLQKEFPKLNKSSIEIVVEAVSSFIFRAPPSVILENLALSGWK